MIDATKNLAFDFFIFPFSHRCIDNSIFCSVFPYFIVLLWTPLAPWSLLVWLILMLLIAYLHLLLLPRLLVVTFNDFINNVIDWLYAASSEERFWILLDHIPTTNMSRITTSSSTPKPHFNTKSLERALLVVPCFIRVFFVQQLKKLRMSGRKIGFL